MHQSEEAKVYKNVVLDSRWKILGQIGGGNFGLVFLAEDNVTKQHAAIKILKIEHAADHAVVREFLDEARFLQMLTRCTNVVESLGSGEYVHILTAANGMSVPLSAHYIAMEAAEGSLTRLLLDDTDVFTWPERLGVLRDVVLGIQQMHRHSVVNRDLKADNVLVFSAPKSSIVAKVADMGRAKSISEPRRATVTQYELPRGDWAFAAPEHIWCTGADEPVLLRATDLYHIGSVLFELAMGTGLTAEVIPAPVTIARKALTETREMRLKRYETIAPDLRIRFELAYENFAQRAPVLIRAEMTGMLRQLTDVQPMQRFRRVHGRPDCSESLDWLVRKIDVMILRLRAAETEARRHARKKAAV